MSFYTVHSSYFKYQFKSLMPLSSLWVAASKIGSTNWHYLGLSDQSLGGQTSKDSSAYDKVEKLS